MPSPVARQRRAKLLPVAAAPTPAPASRGDPLERFLARLLRPLWPAVLPFALPAFTLVLIGFALVAAARHEPDNPAFDLAGWGAFVSLALVYLGGCLEAGASAGLS